jgi:hypothetical protein
MAGDDSRPRRIAAKDVEPGMHIWNPYGGSRGYAKVASAARDVGGHIEFDTTDGRTGRYRASSVLYLNWPAMDADREAEREAGQ